MKSKIKSLVFFLLLFITNYAFATDYYVSTTGNDANSGTINQPFLTINHLLAVIQPGETGYIRGGIYSLNETTHTSGASGQVITITAYNNETVILEGTGNTTNGGRFRIRHNWYHIYGLELRNGDAGFALTSYGSHNIIENCKVHNCYYTGFYLAAGASYNQFINCDAYDMYDSGSNGGNADGFGINGQNNAPGPGNIFIGCRAWHNSDDGFDVWKAGHPVEFRNCYSFNNGTHNGDGNGFKLGINLTPYDIHILKNCMAWGNRQNGFDYNDNELPQVLYNCTAYNNTRNYKFSNANGGPTTDDIQNCISAITQNPDILLPNIINQNTNSWNLTDPNDSNIVSDNFISTDDSIISGNRNPDGSIPDSDFLKLKPDSDFIDAGIDVGLPFNGIAPDFGAFESNFVGIDENHGTPDFSIYPNPTKSYLYITFKSKINTLKLYTISGQNVTQNIEIQNFNNSTLKLNINKLKKGVYILKCNSKASLLIKN